jgi:branched-chain amino acid transport system permease protein
MMILSGDPPRSRVLSLLLIAIVVVLAITPFVFPGAKPLNVAAKICIFAALVASYDLLLGYTGTVSFAHTMFYGIGSYAVAIALYGMGPSWAAVGAGIVIGLPLAALLALVIGLFSLRVEAIFFAMITLAVASAFLVLASQLSWLTGGEDGRSFSLPELLRPGTVFVKDFFGVRINGRILTPSLHPATGGTLSHKERGEDVHTIIITGFSISVLKAPISSAPSAPSTAR